MRSLAEQGPLFVVFRRHGPVPKPNNTTTGRDQDPAWFNEFPSVPRIDAGSDMIATRGQSTPVWMGLVKDAYGSFVETKPGTAGICISSGHGTPTAIGQWERATIVFSGNFAANSVGKTDVVYRDIGANGGIYRARFGNKPILHETVVKMRRGHQ